MPRLTAATPKYRRHRASGKAVVTICGRDHYLGSWKSKASLVEYDRLVGEWLAAGRPSIALPAPGEISVTEICAKFYRYAKQHYRKNGRATGTAENYKPLLSLLKQRYGHTNAAEFGPLALKALRLAMIDQGHSRRYINENTRRLCKIFRWAASEQLVSPLVHQSLSTVEGLRKGSTKARETAPVEPVSDDVVERTLPHLPRVVADMVQLQRLTGARPGEIVAMRPCDVDRSGDVWRYVPAEHKTEHHGRQRTIVIGPRAQAILRPYLLRAAEANCFSPKDSEKQRRAARHQRRITPANQGDGPGTNRKRKPKVNPGASYTNDSYRRAITRACEIAFGMPDALRYPARQVGSDGQKLAPEMIKQLQVQANQWRAKHVWHPHQLRHTAATEIRQQFGLEAAQVILGHSKADVTQIYAARDLEKAAEIARQIAA